MTGLNAPSLSVLTPYKKTIGLTHLGSEASIYGDAVVIGLNKN